MKRKKNLKITAIILAVLFIAGIAELIWENKTVGVTRYTVESEEIPAAFDGYKILLLADIQGTDFGDQLYRKIEKERADLLVFAGDIADTYVPGSEKVIDRLLENCALPEKVYGVNGNHDVASPSYESWKAHWESISAFRMLENESVTLERGGESVTLHGMADPGYSEGELAMRYVREYREKITAGAGYNILLFHRGEMLDMFAEDDFDLIMAGHMHGGQVRVPFLGGLRSPYGRWFPEYSGGQYRVDGRDFIVSRGVGNPASITDPVLNVTAPIPRVLNRGEIVVVTLKSL